MIFVIQTDDEVAGLDITNALSNAGIKHTIVSKQNDTAAQHSVQLTASGESGNDHLAEYNQIRERAGLPKPANR